MACLIVVEGPSAGVHFPLTQESVSIGREDTCTFQVLDPQVSRTHLRVWRDAKTGGHFAGDYRSGNGVFVNDKQVLLDTALKDGDRIRIGQSTLVYMASDHADARAALAAAKKMDEWKHTTILRRDS